MHKKEGRFSSTTCVGRAYACDAHCVARLPGPALTFGRRPSCAKYQGPRLGEEKPPTKSATQDQTLARVGGPSSSLENIVVSVAG